MGLEELSVAEEIYRRAESETDPIDAAVLNNEAAFLTVDYIVKELALTKPAELESLWRQISDADPGLEQAAYHADALFELSMLIAENVQPGEYEINVQAMRDSRARDTAREEHGPRYTMFHDNEMSFGTLGAIALNIGIADPRVQQSISLTQEGHDTKSVDNTHVQSMSKGLYMMSRVLAENTDTVKEYLISK